VQPAINDAANGAARVTGAADFRNDRRDSRIVIRRR